MGLQGRRRLHSETTLSFVNTASLARLKEQAKRCSDVILARRLPNVARVRHRWQRTASVYRELQQKSATARAGSVGGARNRHRHAIEQASRRWRGGRRDDIPNGLERRERDADRRRRLEVVRPGLPVEIQGPRPIQGNGAHGARHRRLELLLVPDFERGDLQIPFTVSNGNATVIPHTPAIPPTQTLVKGRQSPFSSTPYFYSFYTLSSGHQTPRSSTAL